MRAKSYIWIPAKDRIEEIQCIHEGLCPDCGEDLPPYDLGGTETFIDEYSNDGENRSINTWHLQDEDLEPGDARGSMSVTCEHCGRQWDTTQLTCGDWI